MMSQYTVLDRLFADEDFPFCQEELLWPVSFLQQNFFRRRAKLAEGLHNRSPLLTLSQLPVLSSTLAGLINGRNQPEEAASTEWHQDSQQVSDTNRDYLVTLDARGYAPGDITVRLEGRSLAIVAMKQADEDESHSCSSSSSSSSCSASSSSASSQMGFVQKIDLPTHLDLSGLSCSLMHDGQLQIHAPVTKQPVNEESQVPIRYRTSLEFPIGKNNEEHKD